MVQKTIVCEVSYSVKPKAEPEPSTVGGGVLGVVLWSACFFHIDMSV